jgi:hypothetical protein
MKRSVRFLFAFACAAGLAGFLTIGCEQPSSPGTDNTTTQQHIADLAKPGNGKPLTGEFDTIDFKWIVSHFSEQICTNGQSLVAGARAYFSGNTSHLGKTTGRIATAWDWSDPADGKYTPEGPDTGTSATVLARKHFFETNPFATSNPMLPVCERRVHSNGRAVFIGQGGGRGRNDDDDDHGRKGDDDDDHGGNRQRDRIYAKVTGGEVYELSFGNFPGDGQEQFIELRITEGSGRFKDARGTFVIHNIFDFARIQAGQDPLVKSEIINGQIRY